jgi:hypothetical protein
MKPDTYRAGNAVEEGGGPMRNRTSSALIACLGLIGLSVGVVACQQSTIQPTPTTGTLTGRAFLLTSDGSIKPGRLVSVYVLFIPSDADSTFSDQRLKAQDAIDEEKKREDKGLNLGAHLRMWQRQTVFKIEAAVKGLKVTAESDEEGYFEIANLKPGRSSVVAVGLAAGVLCMWQEGIEIHPGRNTIRLVSPYSWDFYSFCEFNVDCTRREVHRQIESFR